MQRFKGSYRPLEKEDAREHAHPQRLTTLASVEIIVCFYMSVK